MLCSLDDELSLTEDEERELQDEEVLVLVDEQLEQEGLLLNLLDDTQLDEDDVDENEKQQLEQLDEVENLDELQLEEQQEGRLSNVLLLEDVE